MDRQQELELMRLVQAFANAVMETTKRYNSNDRNGTPYSDRRIAAAERKEQKAARELLIKLLGRKIEPNEINYILPG